MEKKLILSILFFLKIGINFCQTGASNNNSNGSNISSICDSIKLNKFYYFNFIYPKNTDSFFIDYKSNFSFGIDDSLVKKRKITTDYGITHTYFKHYYKGIEVYSSDLHLQTQAGLKSRLNGTIYHIDSLDTANLISEAQAITIALNSFANNTAYNLEKNAYPNEITVKKIAIQEGQGYIVVYLVNLDVLIDKYANMDVYVNAKTGAIVKKRDVTRRNSNGCTVHYGNQNFRTLDSTHLNFFGCRPRGNNYQGKNIFFDTSRNVRFWTNFNKAIFDTFKDANGIFQNTTYHTNYLYNVPSNQLSNIGCSGNNAILKSGVEAHWLIDKFIDMVQIKYRVMLDPTQLSTSYICNHDPDVTNTNRQFFNVVISDNESTVNKAFFTGSSMTFGRRLTNYELEKRDTPVFLLTADIAGHEMGHFMIKNLRHGGLIHERESGAIEEGIADVMGSLLERYISTGFNANKTPNWTLSEDCNGTPTYDDINGSKRIPYDKNMAYPQERNMPNYIGSPYWKIPDSSCCTPQDATDYCYIHNNSSILSKWFQLLVDGGINKGSPYQYNVPTIPIDSLARLLIETVILTFNDNVTFADLYNITIDNCIIFPPTVRSMYENAIRLAWWSVGVGNPVRTRQTITIPNNMGLIQAATIYNIREGNFNPIYVYSKNRDFILEGNLNIDKGVTFRCEDCNFYVRNNGTIFFKESSKGIFDTCLFTSRDTVPRIHCTPSSVAQSLWQGIKLTPTGTTCIENDAVNASLEFNNSQIEYAAIGIESGSHYICDHQPSLPSPMDGYRNQFGGNVVINNSKFLNNTQDIFYARGDFEDYNLLVKNSSFLFYDSVSVKKQHCIYVKQNYNSIVRDSLNYIKGKAYNTKNFTPIVIDSCMFSTLFEYSFPLIPVIGLEIGLLKNNVVKDMSKVVIRNNIFKGFKKDIKMDGLSEFMCNNNEFRNSITGIEVSRSTMALILSNTFTRTNYSIDMRNSVLDDNNTHSISNFIDTNKFYFLYDGFSQYENKKEIYLSNTKNTNISENNVYSQGHSGFFSDPAYVAFHFVGTDNTRVKRNNFAKWICQGVDANLNQDNNCLSGRHEIPIVWERHDNNGGYFVNNSISNWWTRGIHMRYHNRNVRIKCNDMFPTKAPDHTAIFIDSGEFKNQGEYSTNPINSCSQNNGIYPVANRFLYRANGLAVNDNCTYPTLSQQTQLGISPSAKQIAIKPYNLPSGYVWKYYTQQRDRDNVSTPQTMCKTNISYIDVNNCPIGSPGYTIQSNTCDEANLYLMREPQGGVGSSTPCEQINTWKTHRMNLIDQLQSEPVICGDNHATQERFEVLDASFRTYLDIIDADDHILNSRDTCISFDDYEGEILNSGIVASKYTLAERYIQRNQLSSASALIDQIKTTIPMERSIFCDKRLSHFDEEHERYTAILDLELRQAQRISQGDSTGLSTQELAMLYSFRDNSLGKAAVKAEKLIEQYTGDRLYRRVPGYTVQTTNAPVLVDSGVLLPLTIFPNPNTGQFEVAFEHPYTYTQAQILMYRINQPTQPVLNRTLTSYPRYIQESVQLYQAQEGLYTIILYINNQATAGATVQISY